jgi:hypothetical protein
MTFWQKLTKNGPELEIPIIPILEKSVAVFRENWAVAAQIGFLYLIPYAMKNSAEGSAGIFASAAYLAVFFISPIPNLMLTILYFRQARKEEVSLTACFEDITRRLYYSYLLGSFLWTLLVAIGLAFVIYPGIYLAVCWAWMNQVMIENPENDQSTSWKFVWGCMKYSRKQAIRNWNAVAKYALFFWAVQWTGQVTEILALITGPVCTLAFTEGYLIAAGVSPRNDLEKAKFMPNGPVVPQDPSLVYDQTRQSTSPNQRKTVTQAQAGQNGTGDHYEAMAQ